VVAAGQRLYHLHCGSASFRLLLQRPLRHAATSAASAVAVAAAAGFSQLPSVDARGSGLACRGQLCLGRPAGACESQCWPRVSWRPAEYLLQILARCPVSSAAADRTPAATQHGRHPGALSRCAASCAAVHSIVAVVLSRVFLGARGAVPASCDSLTRITSRSSSA